MELFLFWARTTKTFTRLTLTVRKNGHSRPPVRLPPSPAIAADGTIILLSTDGNLYALQSDGTERLRLHTGGATGVIAGAWMQAGTFILSGKPSTMYPSARTGRKRWD